MPVHPVMAGKFHLLEGVSSIPELFETPVSDALDLIAEAVAGRVRLGGGAR